MRKWEESAVATFATHHYYDESDGRIIGIAHKVGTQNIIYLAKIYPRNEETILGQYINCEYAKMAVENYWFKQDNTLEYTSK